MLSNEPKKGKSTKEPQIKKSPTKPTGRSFCCSMFIYTFVFVSGVIVATVLPDLAGHHFKQPYGKEYGAMVENVFKDLPKHFTSLSETVALLGRDLTDRVWVLKAEVERRISDLTNKKDDKQNQLLKIHQKKQKVQIKQYIEQTIDPLQSDEF